MSRDERFWWLWWHKTSGGYRGGLRMLVRSCVGGELRHSLAERTKALAVQYHALRSPARVDQRSCERRRNRHRKSQTRWYVKVSWVPVTTLVYTILYLILFYSLLYFFHSRRSKPLAKASITNVLIINNTYHLVKEWEKIL